MSFRGDPRNIDDVVAYILEQLRLQQQLTFNAVPQTFGTPANTFGETAAPGSINAGIRVDAQLPLFENVVSTTLNFGDVANKGVSGFGAHRDHRHGMPPDPQAIINSKGDLVVGVSNDLWTRLPVGADGTSLTADSTQPLGLAWETPPANLLVWMEIGP